MPVIITIVISAALGIMLAGCDPGGWYADFKCLERDIETGRCTKAEYTCRPGHGHGDKLAYYKYEGPRCH